MGDRLSVVLLAVGVVLAVLVAAQLHYGTRVAAPIEAYAKVETLPPSTPATSPLPPLSSLTQTVDRPLFTASRRPAPTAPVVAQETTATADASQQSAPTLELSAVVIEDGRRLALFLAPAGGAALRAVQGETVQGWELTEVRADGVTLTLDGRRHDIGLRTFLPPARAEVAAPQQPVAAPPALQRRVLVRPPSRPPRTQPSGQPGARTGTLR